MTAPGTEVRASWSAPSGAPLVRGSAAWLRPHTVTASAHYTPPGEVWLYLSIRGYARDTERWARGQYGARLTVGRSLDWQAPDELDWLELPQLLLDHLHDAALRLALDLPEVTR